MFKTIRVASMGLALLSIATLAATHVTPLANAAPATSGFVMQADDSAAPQSGQVAFNGHGTTQTQPVQLDGDYVADWYARSNDGLFQAYLKVPGAPTVLKDLHVVDNDSFTGTFPA